MYVDVVAVEMAKQAERNAKALAKGRKSEAEIESRAGLNASNASTTALKAAMNKVTEIIRGRIEAGRTADGNKVKELSEKYEDYKKDKHGFVKPIGTATGQVLANLAPGNQNIKITKS